MLSRSKVTPKNDHEVRQDCQLDGRQGTPTCEKSVLPLRLGAYSTQVFHTASNARVLRTLGCNLVDRI